MAQSKVTKDALELMASLLSKSKDEILNSKQEMDNQLQSFVWDDPTGWYFTSKYEEDFKPIIEKLIPNIEQYLEHISNLGIQIEEYVYDASLLAALGIGGLGVATNFTKKISNTTASGIPLTNPPLPFRDDEFDKSLEGMSKEELEHKAQVYRDYLEKAQMSEYAYNDGGPLPKGWIDVSQDDPNVKKICDDIAKNGGDASGLKFSVLKSEDSDQYIVSFAGTDFNKGLVELGKDAYTDVEGAVSLDERQSQLSKDLVRRLVLNGGIPLNQIEFTGHSLGGRLAAECSVDFVRPATTFNAAGSNPDYYRKYNDLINNRKNAYSYLGIRNVVAEHDPLTKIQSSASLSKNHYINAIPKENIKIAHETTSGTLKSAPAKLLSGTSPVRVLNGVDSVLGAADKFNNAFNRDYRALGATLTLPDQFHSYSIDAHRIVEVEDLLSKRLEMIEKRL